jgi:hypothetical protein
MNEDTIPRNYCVVAFSKHKTVKAEGGIADTDGFSLLVQLVYPSPIQTQRVKLSLINYQICKMT